MIIINCLFFFVIHLNETLQFSEDFGRRFLLLVQQTRTFFANVRVSATASPHIENYHWISCEDKSSWTPFRHWKGHTQFLRRLREIHLCLHLLLIRRFCIRWIMQQARLWCRTNGLSLFNFHFEWGSRNDAANSRTCRQSGCSSLMFPTNVISYESASLIGANLSGTLCLSGKRLITSPRGKQVPSLQYL